MNSRIELFSNNIDKTVEVFMNFDTCKFLKLFFPKWLYFHITCLTFWRLMSTIVVVPHR